jgi:hypothetical protein
MSSVDEEARSGKAIRRKVVVERSSEIMAWILEHFVARQRDRKTGAAGLAKVGEGQSFELDISSDVIPKTHSSVTHDTLSSI